MNNFWLPNALIVVNQRMESVFFAAELEYPRERMCQSTSTNLNSILSNFFFLNLHILKIPWIHIRPIRLPVNVDWISMGKHLFRERIDW
jgi:hypothetical protein